MEERPNFLPKNKILDWSKFKATAGDKINATDKLKFVLEWFENTVGKGENAVPAFSPFPTMFSKGFFLLLSKFGIVLCTSICLLSSFLLQITT